MIEILEDYSGVLYFTDGKIITMLENASFDALVSEVLAFQSRKGPKIVTIPRNTRTIGYFNPEFGEIWLYISSMRQLKARV
jgi:hypothetical protein